MGLPSANSPPWTDQFFANDQKDFDLHWFVGGGGAPKIISYLCQKFIDNYDFEV